MKRRILCGTFLLLVFSPLLVQAKDSYNWERPIPNLPTPWEGVCFVATPALNAAAQARGISPQTVHECSLSLDRFDIILTVSAFHPVNIPLLKINYFGASANSPLLLRFPNGTVFTAPPPPPEQSKNRFGLSNGWLGPEADTHRQGDPYAKVPSASVQRLL